MCGLFSTSSKTPCGYVFASTRQCSGGTLPYPPACSNSPSRPHTVSGLPYPSISNISCQNLHQLALVDGIKELFQVHIHRPHFASVQIFSAFLESVVGTSFRSETITRFCEFRFVDWRQHLRNCLLDDTVYCCWDSQFSCLTVVLWNFYPSDGLRLVFSSQNGLSDLLAVVFEILQKFIQIPAMATEYASVQLLGFDLFGSLTHIFSLHDFCSSSQ